MLGSSTAEEFWTGMLVLAAVLGLVIGGVVLLVRSTARARQMHVATIRAHNERLIRLAERTQLTFSTALPYGASRPEFPPHFGSVGGCFRGWRVTIGVVSFGADPLEFHSEMKLSSPDGARLEGSFVMTRRPKRGLGGPLEVRGSREDFERCFTRARRSAPCPGPALEARRAALSLAQHANDLRFGGLEIVFRPMGTTSGDRGTMLYECHLLDEVESMEARLHELCALADASSWQPRDPRAALELSEIERRRAALRTRAPRE